MEFLDTPPPAARSNSGWNFGRYRRPIPDPAIAAPGPFGRYRLKEWHYSSFVTADWFFAFAAIQLGYSAKVFAYLVDRKNPSVSHEYSVLAPLGKGLSFAPSSVRGETLWTHDSDSLRACYREGWIVDLDLSFGRNRLRGSLRMDDADALALLFLLPNGQPAYTHKGAGFRAGGELKFGNQTLLFDGATGTIDWTRSVALRKTRWQWCSLAGVTAAGDRVGLNLSAQVYADATGDSAENGFWCNGRVYTLGKVDFSIPPDPRREPWVIRSSGSDEVRLEFTPAGTREEHLNLGIVKSDFIQPYGTFRGTVRIPDGALHDVSGLFGVVEKHLSIW